MSGRKVVLLVFAIPTFAFFGLIFFAAWSDYQDRGCPGAWQCSDAIGTMIVAGMVLTLMAVLVGFGFWPFKRHKKRNE